jgi:hypothetical protein
MLATTGGELVELSSPAGKRGQFWQNWRYGGDLWERWLITADDLPDDRYKPSKTVFLAEERAALPRAIFRQEYYCEFLEAEDAVFVEEDIVATVTPEITPLFPQHRRAS